MTPTGDRADLALLGVCSVVRGLLSGATRDEVLTRYRVGEALRMVKGMPHTYGTQSVERIAAELGLAAPVLYRYIAVAESWSPEDLKRQTEKTNRFGQPLSWSHFLALTRAPESARVPLLDKCLENAWSVRDLRLRIERLAKKRSAERAGARAADAVHTALREGIQNAHRAVAEFRALVETLDDRSTGLEDPIDAELLARAVETLEELHAGAEATLVLLRGAGQSQRRILCAPSSGYRAPPVGDTSSEDEEDDSRRGGAPCRAPGEAASDTEVSARHRRAVHRRGCGRSTVPSRTSR